MQISGRLQLLTTFSCNGFLAWRSTGLWLLLLLFLCSNSVTADTSSAKVDMWSALRSGGHIVLMRHAIAPGVGDPVEFRIGDCSTQRNLSATGRLQAEKVGHLFRRNGIAEARLFSSQWCRCLETAELLDLGTVMELPLLNSFFRNRHNGETQTAMLRRWLGEQDLRLPLILVTHQVNITALSGVYPASGELVLLRRENDDTFVVAGTLRTD